MMTYEKALHTKPDVMNLDFEGNRMVMSVPMDWLETALSALEEAENRTPERQGDKVEVIRCKNCTHGELICGEYVMCDALMYKRNQVYARKAVSPNHFCSWGERKAE